MLGGRAQGHSRASQPGARPSALSRCAVGTGDGFVLAVEALANVGFFNKDRQRIERQTWRRRLGGGKVFCLI